MSLEVQNISLMHNGEVFLEDISFTATPGITVLVGPTLAGKTSLMRVIAGLVKPDSGIIKVNGVDVGDLAVKDRSVSFVYQQFINYPSLTVFDNIASPLTVLKPKMTKDEIKSRVYEVAEMLRITALLDRKPSALSGGQQQRVAIARSLSRKSDVVLLDEPLANLDFKLREQLRDELQRIFADADMMVIYSTAEPIEALDMATHTVVLGEGRVQQHGDALQMYANPINLSVAQAMSDPPINLLNSTSANGRVEIAGSSHQAVGLLVKAPSSGVFNIGIRPHCVKLSSNAPDDIPISGKVKVSEITGSVTYVHVDIGDQEDVVLELEGTNSYQPGHNLTVFLDHSALFGFDHATGETLFTPGVVK